MMRWEIDRSSPTPIALSVNVGVGVDRSPLLMGDDRTSLSHTVSLRLDDSNLKAIELRFFGKLVQKKADRTRESTKIHPYM